MSELQTIPQEESARLAECEATISKGLNHFVAVGTALLVIRDYRLYRATHSNFGHYCTEKWGLSKRHADRTIEASQIAGMLPVNPAVDAAISPLKVGPIGPSHEDSLPAPKSESSIRSLSKIPKEKVAETYARAVEIAGGESPTAAQTEQAVQEQKDKLAQAMGYGTTEEANEAIAGEEEKKKSPPSRPGNGLQYSMMAINQLKKIDPRDTQRTEAFDQVIAWINKQN